MWLQSCTRIQNDDQEDVQIYEGYPVGLCQPAQLPASSGWDRPCFMEVFATPLCFTFSMFFQFRYNASPEEPYSANGL